MTSAFSLFVLWSTVCGLKGLVETVILELQKSDKTKIIRMNIFLDGMSRKYNQDIFILNSDLFSAADVQQFVAKRNQIF